MWVKLISCVWVVCCLYVCVYWGEVYCVSRGEVFNVLLECVLGDIMCVCMCVLLVLGKVVCWCV